MATKLPPKVEDPVPLPAGSPEQLITVFNKTYVPFFEFDSEKYRLVLNVDKDFLNGSFNNGRYESTL